MRHPRIRRRGVEAGLIGLAGFDGLLHLIVDLEDDTFGSVLAVFCLVLATDNREGIK